MWIQTSSKVASSMPEIINLNLRSMARISPGAESTNPCPNTSLLFAWPAKNQTKPNQTKTNPDMFHDMFVHDMFVSVKLQRPAVLDQ